MVHLLSRVCVWLSWIQKNFININSSNTNWDIKILGWNATSKVSHVSFVLPIKTSHLCISRSSHRPWVGMSFPPKTFIHTVPTKTVLPTHPFLAQLILLSNSIKKVVLYNISYQKTLVQKSYRNLNSIFSQFFWKLPNIIKRIISILFT